MKRHGHKIMDNSFARITKNKSLVPLLTLFSLVLASLSVYCLILPFIKDIKAPLNYAFIAVGGLGSLYFTFTVFNYAYQLVKPKNALLVSDEGFLDLVNGGNGAGFVPWSNVRCVEMSGSEERPYIGIGLIDANEVMKTSRRSLEKQITEMSGAGKPELMFRPFEIGCTLEEAYGTLRDCRTAYLRTVDHGDTNVLYEEEPGLEPTRTLPVGAIEEALKANAAKIQSPVKKAGTAAVKKEDTAVKIEDTESADNADTEDLIGESHKQAKTVDELLAELSDSIGKSRNKLEGGEMNEELEQFIKKLNDKNKKDGKK
jgi:hypothetical protein